MNARKQGGFSVVELMVAMALSLVLMAGVLSILFSTKVTYFANEHTARLQENGRVALDLIVNNLRSSGYPGCMKPSPSSPFVTSLNSANTLLWNFSLPLQGSEYTSSGTWTPAVGVVLNPAPVDGSDILVVRSVSRDVPALVVPSDMANGVADISVPNSVPAPVSAGQIMMVSDCLGTAVFQVTGYVASAPNGSMQHAAAGAAPGNATEDFGFGFRAGARVIPVQTTIYYVANGADGGPSLWRQVGVAPAEELIQGVQALQVAYGEDTDADRITNQYVAADAVGDWMDVISVTISLLLRSEAAGTDVDSRTYDLLTAGVGGESVGPFNDRRLRMLFTTTTAVRNRAL